MGKKKNNNNVEEHMIKVANKWNFTVENIYYGEIVPVQHIFAMPFQGAQTEAFPILQ